MTILFREQNASSGALFLKTFIAPDFTYLNARNAKLYRIQLIKGDAM